MLRSGRCARAGRFPGYAGPRIQSGDGVTNTSIHRHVCQAVQKVVPAKEAVKWAQRVRRFTPEAAWLFSGDPLVPPAIGGGGRLAAEVSRQRSLITVPFRAPERRPYARAPRRGRSLGALLATSAVWLSSDYVRPVVLLASFIAYPFQCRGALCDRPPSVGVPCVFSGALDSFKALANDSSLFRVARVEHVSSTGLPPSSSWRSASGCAFCSPPLQGQA